MNEIDVRILAQEDLPPEVFPGGRNEVFRVYFTAEVHAAVWEHAVADTSVEICGVLVGSWHHDEAGPFVKIVASIRGEGAETRFAEVTFTHQTWAKINAEMDSRFTALKIVGWYHTHPDFGIFLSDRDRFIQEHFFAGPGQVAYVIDPIRGIEGVFVWREGRPSPTEHYWVGDRIVAGESRKREGLADEPGEDPGRHGPQGRGPAPGARAAEDRGAEPGTLFPPPWRLMIYLGVLLTGYLLATLYAAWERQRFVEIQLATNGLVSVLRLGLSDELDQVLRDLEALAQPIDTVQSKESKAGASLDEVRSQLASVGRRITAIKARYGYTHAEEEMLRRIVLEKLSSSFQSESRFQPQSTQQKPKADVAVPSPSAPTADVPRKP